MEKVIIQEMRRIKMANNGDLQSTSVMSKSTFDMKRQGVNLILCPFLYRWYTFRLLSSKVGLFYCLSVYIVELLPPNFLEKTSLSKSCTRFCDVVLCARLMGRAMMPMAIETTCLMTMKIIIVRKLLQNINNY